MRRTKLLQYIIALFACTYLTKGLEPGYPLGKLNDDLHQADMEAQHLLDTMIP